MSHASSPPHSKESRGRILIVDDTGYNRIIMDRCLTSAGYAVTQAADGMKALQLLKKQAFDLVITDMIMPGMSGVELLIKSRASRSEDSPCPPFILCTAIQEKDTIQTAILNGFSEILIKPIDYEKLLALVEKHIGIPKEDSAIPKADGETETRSLQNLAEKLGSNQEVIQNVIIEEVLLWKPVFESTSLEELRQKLRQKFQEEDGGEGGDG